MIDRRAATAQLDRLAERLDTPCRLGAYELDGLICRTSTALIFVGRGGAFGAAEGVLKLTGNAYAPLLARELRLLNQCRERDLRNIVRPVRPELEWLDDEAAAMLLPFLDGGDLVQWIGAHGNGYGSVGPHLALEVGQQVGGILRTLLQLPRPVVHRDVKPQNVLLARPGAPLTELTLIDFDVSEELDIPHEDFAWAPREVAESLVGDVRGFGELLFDLATGRDPPAQGTQNPNTGHDLFDALVETCLTSGADGAGYVSLADTRLWHDLESALAASQARVQTDADHAEQRRRVPLRARRYLAVAGVFLFVGLLVAVASKVLAG